MDSSGRVALVINERRNGTQGQKALCKDYVGPYGPKIVAMGTRSVPSLCRVCLAVDKYCLLLTQQCSYKL